MSGYAEEQLSKSIDIENVNFLPKPFSVTELAEAARNARPTDTGNKHFAHFASAPYATALWKLRVRS